MRSLFLRIFLAFWLTSALAGLAFVIATALMQPEPFWQYVTGDASASDARSALEVYERDGAQALAAHLERLGDDRGARVYVFDDAGTEVTGREYPRFVHRIARAEADVDQQEVVFNPSAAPALAMRLATAPSGRVYRVVFWSPRFQRSQFSLSPGTIALRGLLVLLVSAAVCYALARSLTSPILRVRTAAHDIAAGDLTARVGPALVRRKDELADLGRDFDAMADRIETLVAGQQRLLGDISHELRSPLARLGVALDLARQREGRDVADLLGRIELEAGRLDELIGELLVLNRLETGDAIERSAVDLTSLVGEIASDADFEAQTTHRSTRLAEAEPCTVQGDRDLLRRAVENVTRNALRYTAEGTTVDLSVRREGGEAVVHVRDRGAGVPDAELPNLFRPFYRVAGARDRNTGGVGLGLAITERAVARHGGTVRARNVPDGGLEVEIRLPLG